MHQLEYCLMRFNLSDSHYSQIVRPQWKKYEVPYQQV